MSVQIPEQDPAYQLWRRCDQQALTSFWDLLNNRPVPVGQIAQRLGLRVTSKTLPTDISGSIRLEGDTYRIEVNNTDAPVRQRFTVSHEIGHFLLHRSLIDAEGITDTIMYRSNLSNAKEAEANRLAAAMLLPWHSVLDWHQNEFGSLPCVENVERIATTFKASRLAVGYRFGF